MRYKAIYRNSLGEVLFSSMAYEKEDAYKFIDNVSFFKSEAKSHGKHLELRNIELLRDVQWFYFEEV